MKLKQCILALVAVLSSFALTGYALVTSGTLVTTEAELAEALTTGGDVTLNADIAVSTMIPIRAGVTAKLDLNGHAITSGYQSGSDSKHIYPLDVYGNLTIEDSQENGSITGRGIYVQDGSRLTIEGGAVYGIDANGGSALFQYGGDIVINGGHVEQKATGTTNFAINAKAGTVTINGGWVGGNHGAVATFGAVVVLEGGKFVCTGTAGMTDNVLYSTSNGTLTVNGGTFVADNDGPSGGCCVYDENGKTIINAGDFSNSSGGDVWGTTGTTINGGTFENLTETTHVTVGSTITNAGKTYTMTDEGLQEATIVSVTTFAELKAAVEAGKSVILANDITTTAAIVTAGVTSEIDLNGKTLTIGAGDNKFNDASNVTIKNGTIDITGLTVNGNAAFCLDEYETTLVTTVTLNDVDVVGNGYSSAYGIFYIGKSSVLNVNGGEWNLANDTFAAGGVFKADASSATLNIDGLKLTAHNVRRGVTYAATTIANSTIAFSGDADGVDAEMEHGFNRSPLAITNSTITMTDMVGRGITAQEGAVTISENSTVTMTNCQEATIDVRNGQTVTVDNTSTVTVDAEPTISSGNINGTVTVTTAGVAKIGEVEYKTLQAAIDAAQAGETITVLRDITLTEGVTVAADDEITLNLNGMTISQEKECTASYQMIQNNGSLTITGDGKISFKDTSAGDSSFGWGSYTINNRGTLVVENGTIEHLGEQAFATHMICAIQQGAGSTTINGGLISTPNYRSVRINAGSLTINGGEFDGQVWLQPNQGDATLAVTGGTFAPNGRDASSIFMTNTGENNTVSGASISGGTFTTKIGCSDASKLAGTISGGSFSEAAVSGTNTDLLVAGYEFETEADANGYYGIEWTGNVDELVIVDGELTEFVNEQEMTIGKLTYKRTLSSESYNALYVPFEIPVDSLSDNYDVFYIYDVRSYDNDEDGTPDDWDMEVFKFNKGTLKANYPYFIRPKSTAALDMVLTLEDATLCKSEEKSVVCSSVFMTYEVKGLYHKVESGDLYGHYGISNKGRWIPIRNAVLSPFRFHLKMTNNDGSSVNVSEEALSSMRIRVIGEGSTTDIEHLKQESNRPAEIYDMQGRRVQTPAKGFYIVNGKKVYIK